MRVEGHRSVSGRPPGGPRGARVFSAAIARARAEARAVAAASVARRALAPEPGAAASGQGARGGAATARGLDGELGGRSLGDITALPTSSAAGGCEQREGALTRSPSLAAARLEPLVIELASLGGAPSMLLAFGSDGILVQLTQRPGGVELVLELPASAVPGPELQTLTAAVRARGVAVVKKGVRVRMKSAACPAARALTSAQGSYRNAAQLNEDGTVAKW